MSKYINADDIENAKFQAENLRGMGDGVAYRVGWNEAIDAIIENAPTIDIVRCGECKNFHDRAYPYSICGRTSTKAEDDDFCSYGERSE